jgi:hypothetical protein
MIKKTVLKGKPIRILVDAVDLDVEAPNPAVARVDDEWRSEDATGAGHALVDAGVVVIALALEVERCGCASENRTKS